LSPLESSDDDLPLRPSPSDADVKAAVLTFLKAQDLALLTKGMVKEELRHKFGDYIVKAKRNIIATSIEEGLKG
jgi:DEK C terminal domain